MSFAQFNLHPNVIKAISLCHYKSPTPVQAATIPYILEGEDVVACAPTGTGKTAAFVLPALNLLCSQPHSKKTHILVLTPTRELASQIAKAAATYGKFAHFKIINLVGGMPYPPQIRDLKRGADLIVATPGRLLDHIRAGRLDLSGIEILVLDEADRMLDMGFIDDVQEIARLTPSNRQTLLFSATVDKQLAASVKHLLKNPVKIDLSEKTITAPQIHQEIYKVKDIQQKNKLLQQLLTEKNIFKALIFSGTKVHADRLANQLYDLGFHAEALHGDMRQGARNRVIEKFRRGKIQFLVATDVASRGIDIGDITHVINFDMPRFNEDYVHRIGRTGRAGKSGIAISFILPNEVRHLQRLEKFIGQKFKLLQADGTEIQIQHEHKKKKFGDNEGRHKKKKHFFGKKRKLDDDNSDRRESKKKRFATSDQPAKKSPYKKSEDFASKNPDGSPRNKKKFKKKNRNHSQDFSGKKPFAQKQSSDKSGPAPKRSRFKNKKKKHSG